MTIHRIGSVYPLLEMHELIEKNNRLLLLMEHFKIDFTVSDNTIEEICKAENISVRLFVWLCNLYCGVLKNISFKIEPQEVLQVIDFLKNTHNYYKDDKYPEIKFYINKLKEINDCADMALIENFFDTYFNEVKQHLEVEESSTFPYLESVINNASLIKNIKTHISDSDHENISNKLADLKNLLLKHIKLNDKDGLKRKLLSAIFELEFDLNIHSIIEEQIILYTR